jgi:hypothetical protein
LGTAAEAAPFYLRCDGKMSVTDETITYYVKIDGTKVTVENYLAVPIDNDYEDILSFGPIGDPPGVQYGFIDRFTGHAEISFVTPEKSLSTFEGVCRKAERLF